MKRQTAKSSARRLQILEAAAACFRKKGIRATSINDICTRLKISPGHLYYYFKSKEALIEAILMRMEESMIARVRKLAAQDHALGLLLDADQQAYKRQDLQLDLDDATLLEFYVEAKRNPRLGKAVQRFWSASVAEVRPIAQAARREGLGGTDDLETLMDAITMFFAARLVSQIANPVFDEARYRARFKRLIQPLIK